MAASAPAPTTEVGTFVTKDIVGFLPQVSSAALQQLLQRQATLLTRNDLARLIVLKMLLPRESSSVEIVTIPEAAAFIQRVTAKLIVAYRNKIL